MSTIEVLNAKLLEFGEWVNNLSELDNNTIQEYQNEIKLKGRNFVKFHAEVKILNDEQLITKFKQLMQQFKTIKAISNGQEPPPPPTPIEDDKKSQSPEPKDNDTKNTESSSCIMGKDCNNNDPKHFYDFIHFDHPKSDEMIIKYEKYLKKQKCKQIYEKHTKNKTNTSEFGEFLTDQELAQQLQAMQDIQTNNTNHTNNTNNSNKRVRIRRKKQIIIYKDDDLDENKESSEEDNDSDEDFDENEVRRSYRRKIKNKKKENQRRKLQEDTMDIDELEKLRAERLNKLLAKTESYMKTLTRRVRKNFKQNKNTNNNTNNNNNKKVSELSANQVRSFLTGDSGKNEAIEQTKSLVGGTLKDYQQIGLKWMVTLNQMRLNGILADEMGLGKTVQVLALFAFLLDNDGTRGKHLIVAPLSTLSSWRDHFATWLPSLNVYLHRGVASERKAKLISINKEQQDDSHTTDVVISTYQMVIRDAETMSNIKWCYLIVDEAHTLKNSKGRLFESLNAFSTRHRLLLTGTPLQNNLNELWSLLNFILPSIFDSAQSFESWFCSPFQHLHKKDKNKNKMDITMSDNERLMVMDRLHRAIDPFLLRRMKKNVLPQLVKKKEIVIKVAISGLQAAIYKQLQKYGALKYKLDKKRHAFNNIMMQLRKCANHPYLFYPHHKAYADGEGYDINDEIYQCSGKFVLLRHLIPKMIRFGHRMLIFCQFVQTMDILSEFFDFINEAYLRIDGGTDSDDRIDFLEEYNSDNCDISLFLLSTRACGLGLNLYSADTVILFDSDWNPQQDLQAMARCHRIGQTKEVRVFRLIADNTIEESIYNRAQKKLDLERKAIECGKFDFSISGKERKAFLQQILAQRMNVDDQIEKYNSNIERKKLNELLSRTEVEWKEFEEMDEKNGYKGLLCENKLPEWIEEISTEFDVEEVLPQKRKRKEISYNENEFWKGILGKIENDKEGNKENEKDKKKNVKRNNRKRKRNDVMDDNKNCNGGDKNMERKKRKIGK